MGTSPQTSRYVYVCELASLACRAVCAHTLQEATTKSAENRHRVGKNPPTLMLMAYLDGAIVLLEWVRPRCIRLLPSFLQAIRQHHWLFQHAIQHFQERPQNPGRNRSSASKDEFPRNWIGQILSNMISPHLSISRTSFTDERVRRIYESPYILANKNARTSLDNQVGTARHGQLAILSLTIPFASVG